MTKTDTSERGLERLICTALTGGPCDAAYAPPGVVREPRAPHMEEAAGFAALRRTTTASTVWTWPSFVPS